jgi:replicative DNA helicase
MVQELNFQAHSDRLPPQNIDAEEAILGGILLDPEAISRVVELLRPEAFYISAHQEIYKATIALQAQGRPTDLMSVTSWLSDRGLLDKIGGPGRLAQLIDRTISAVNIDQYAQLVTEKYTRRKLIQAGNEISQLGYDTNASLEKVLDQSEQKVFSLAQDRVSRGLAATADILTTTFSDIESRSLGLVLPGISCGFYDLDAMTQGFQRSDLIITAGRPAMGKCLDSQAEILRSDGSIATIEEIYQQKQARLLTLGEDWKFKVTEPSAFVDDGIKPVFRVTTRLGRFVESTLTHPYLTVQGWRKLSELKPGDRVAVPRQLEVFGTETMRDCEVKLLAYLIGDGCLTCINPSFTNTNPKIQNDFVEAVTEFGNLKVRIDSSETRATSFHVSSCLETVWRNQKIFGDRLSHLIISSPFNHKTLAQNLGVSPSLISMWKQGICSPNQETFGKLCYLLEVTADDLVPGGFTAIDTQNALTAWLRKLGLWSKNAFYKTVPEPVFKLQRSQLALFINRLFSTDGWATVLSSGQAQLGFATVSEKLARQLQHLLLRFGIIAALKLRSIKSQDSRRPAWQLDITDASSIKNFIAEIGIFGKEAALAQVQAAISQRQYHSNRDLIPIAVWDQITAAKGSEPWVSLARRAGIAGYSNIHVGKRAPTRERLFILATALENIELQNLATSDVYWDEIVSIEYKGDRQVYDLTIPETHNFVANDICVHNTSFVLNIARNIAAFHKLPIAVFSLEMSKEQLVYRLLSSEAQVESGRLRAGRISQNEWEPLGHAISVLSQLPLFIDDTPNITVTEMRSKARRLQAEQGGALGLILIDYLQLMEGSGSDNRVQELSKVTRSLKGLARELNVPVIALSQLSRGVESRTNKRPMMSDLRESGCITGDTLITLADSGAQVPIRDLVGQSGFMVWAVNEATMQLEKATVSRAFPTGSKAVFQLKTALGRGIRATANHKFLTIQGWKRLDELVVGDRIALPRQLPSASTQTMGDAELALLGHLIGDGCTLPRHAIQYTTRERDLAEIVVSLTTQIFGNQVNPRIVKERDWYQVYLAASQRLTHGVRNPVAKWLETLGAFGFRSYEKFVPPLVFEQPQEAIAIFLRHLWSTDGSIKVIAGRSLRSIAYYASSSPQLARDVQSLLLRLGINARLKVSPQKGKGRDQHQVVITGKIDLERFTRLIGAIGAYKQEALQEIVSHLSGITANTNRDMIDHHVWKMYAVPAIQAAGVTTRQMQAQLGIPYCGTGIYEQNISRERATRLAQAVQSQGLSLLANSDIYWDQIQSIEPDGLEKVFDLTVPGLHNFVANDIVVHNSIEQDADLIIMLYRDEYYNEDTPDRGIAEIIITKHRNGPVGTVKVLFEPQFTRFRNLAAPNRP